MSLSRMSTGLVLIAGMLLASACQPVRPAGPAPAPTTGSVDTAQPVTVAFLAPQSAQNAGAAALGRALVNAARLAARDLNDPLLDLKVFDTGGDPGKATASTQTALAGGADLILGPLFSSSTDAVAQIARQRDVKVISFSTDSNIAGDPVYLSGFLPEIEAARVLDFARARGITTTAILYPRTPAGEVALRGAMSAAGANLVARTSYERTADGIVAGVGDFADQVRQTGPVGLMVADSGQALLLAMDELAQNGIEQPNYRFLGLGQWNSQSTLGSRRFRNAWFPAPDPDALDRFVSRYRAAYGETPPTLAVLGYDAVSIAGQLIADARASGSRNPFSASALTRPQGFRGAIGPIRFRRDGLGERGMVILEVGPREFFVVDPAPVSFGSGA